ncbi:MAG TPA: hypothetical protein VGN17_02010 [Bryobacteraceae bacterium]|jgi:integrase
MKDRDPSTPIQQLALMDGRLHLYKRSDSRYWQCSTFLEGRNRRATTGEDSLPLAREFAEDWYLELRGKQRAGILKRREGVTFREAAKKFDKEYEVLTAGERSPKHVEMHKLRLRVHLLPYFGDMRVSEITAGVVQDYRIHRIQNPYVQKGRKPESAKPPSRVTLHHEVVVLRLVLRTAERYGWLQAVPNFSPPYKASGKISHRAWFSPEEYKKLYEATRRRAKHSRKRWKWTNEQMHDEVLFIGNTGVRPDEAARLEHRDVEIVEDLATGETILVIEVRGKRGSGYCKSMPGAVRPYERLVERNKPQPTDRLFPGHHRELFNAILDEENLKFDRDGRPRTLYSLRHTYICFRLLEGADIYQLAKNCRTSVEMIEKYYAAHIKSMLDARAINVRRPKDVRVKPGKQPKAA